MAAVSAEDDLFLSFIYGPCLRLMTGFSVTFETRKPAAAAPEFNGNNVDLAVVMKTTRLFIDLDTINFFTMNLPHCRNL